MPFEQIPTIVDTTTAYTQRQTSTQAFAAAAAATVALIVLAVPVAINCAQPVIIPPNNILC